LAEDVTRIPTSKGVTARVAAIVLFVVLGIWATADVVRMGDDLPWHVMYDFADFYCAGSALDHDQSPYTYEPLRSCEHRLNASRVFLTNPAFAVPAPQPPGDFLPFMALAKLGAVQARELYACCIAVAVVFTAIVLSRLRIPLDVAMVALVLSTGFVELDAGQIVAFAMLLLVLAGWALAQHRDWLAGVFGGMTVIEPHLGLSVVLALLLFVPRARILTIVTVALLVALGLWVAGAASGVVYLAHVLPAQASAEVPFPYQYSLTYLLHFAGVSDAFALGLGSLSLLAALAAGLCLAPNTAAALQRRELLVYLPAVSAVIAGAYVHMVELCFAVPAALVLARWSRGALHVLATAALCVLATPWIAAWGVKKLFLANLFVCAFLAYRLRVPAAAGVAIVAAIGVFLYVLELHPPVLPAPVLPAAYAPGALVQVEWQAFAYALDTHDPLWVAVKIPTWCALAMLLGTAAAIARRADGTPSPAA
jgi:Glycosyltransferase family 87